jgi:hypothetical protein
MWLSTRATLKEEKVSLAPLELESRCTGKAVETRQTLTLAELGHDADRDRPTHLFMAGYDDTVPQRAHCDTLVKPPFRPRDGTRGEDMCLVCLAISAWMCDASDNDYEEWVQSRRADTAS